MGPLRFVMTVQAVVLLVYALPMLLVPRYWTVLTQQAPLPENYILRGFAGQPAFYGVAWYWGLNAVVTAVFAIAVVVANRRR